MNGQPPPLSRNEELVILTMNKHPRYGEQIINKLSEKSEDRISLNYGSLYPLLHRLEKEGLIQSWQSEENLSIRGGHRRRYYKITELGRLALEQAEQLRWKLRNDDDEDNLEGDFQPST